MIKKLNDFKLNEGAINPQISEEQKQKAMIDWEEKDIIKQNQIGAYDKKKEIPISNNKLGFLKFLSIIGIISILIISLAFAVWGWTIYQDKTLLNPIALVCSNVSLTCEKQICTAEKSECNCICQNNCSEIKIQVINGSLA